ncbi:MAG: phosphodiester glycosidase family protein, partial [Bacteroidota bacterium]|nr:phosphodiester glycosidase family protein [Bacteroidota bacterium]
MKRTLLILFVLCSVLKAQTDYRLDTLMCRYIGPGTVYTRIKASAPWDIYVLRIDLKNPYIKVESIKAKDRYAGRELVSSMAARKSTEGHFALGAVNGDFYDMSNGKTCNIQIENGEIIRTPASKISTIGFSSSNKPMLNFVSYSGVVVASNGVSNRISNVNESRGTDQLILYNSYMGDATGTNSYGTEVLVRPVTAWGANDTVKCVVEKIQNGAGNMQLTPSYAVLSGNGTSASFLSNNLKLGDTVKLYQSVTPGLSKLTQMIGGYPKIVYKGLNYSQQGYFDEGGPDHYANLDPRTGAGFSYDSTYLYLVALDGFENGSAGATLNQLADVMISLGVCNGINLDGGGSTTMYVRGTVVN